MIPIGMSVWQQFFTVLKNGILLNVPISFIFTHFVILLTCTITLKALLATPIKFQQPWQVPAEIVDEVCSAGTLSHVRPGKCVKETASSMGIKETFTRFMLWGLLGTQWLNNQYILAETSFGIWHILTLMIIPLLIQKEWEIAVSD